MREISSGSVIPCLAPGGESAALPAVRAGDEPPHRAEVRRRGRSPSGAVALIRRHQDLAAASRALAGEAYAVAALQMTFRGVVITRIWRAGLGWNEDELLGLGVDRLWDKLPLYSGGSSLRSWAWVVTLNYLRNWKRDALLNRLRTVSLDQYAESADVPAPREFDPDFALDRAHAHARVRQLVMRIVSHASAQLRPDEWELVQRVVVHGHPYALIAAERHELPGTLRARVFRALSRLRATVAAELGSDAVEYLSEL